MRRMVAGALAVLTVPAAAQNSLPGLENFTLDRRPPQPTASPTPTPSASPAAVATTVPTPPPPVVALPTPRATASPRATPSAGPSAGPSATRPAATTPSPAATPSAVPTITPTPTVAASPGFATTTPDRSLTDSAYTDWSPAWLRWVGLVAVALVLGGAAWWWRRRREAALASTWDEPVVAPEPRPETVAVPAVPAPSPGPLRVAPTSPGGFITTALRPELAFELLPLTAGIDALRASVDFQLTVANVGRAPAQDVMVEAWLIGAGTDPRAELEPLFAQPAAELLLAPFVLPATAKADLTSQAVAPREVLATITAGERRLFVPLLAVRATCRDARGQPIVATAAFLIGVPRPGQERLAPLALDRGARGYAQVAARRFS